MNVHSCKFIHFIEYLLIVLHENSGILKVCGIWQSIQQLSRYVTMYKSSTNPTHAYASSQGITKVRFLPLGLDFMTIDLIVVEIFHSGQDTTICLATPPVCLKANIPLIRFVQICVQRPVELNTFMHCLFEKPKQLVVTFYMYFSYKYANRKHWSFSILFLLFCCSSAFSFFHFHIASSLQLLVFILQSY